MSTTESSTPFDTSYNALNVAQKTAVDTIDGPVMVIAGPGTGKTHILTLRIANILARTDANPGNILALTFTDSAAKTMRARLLSLIGTPAYSVRIETFHALADTLIREYPEFFPFERDASPLSQLEQFNIIRELLDNPALKYLRTPGSKYHYAKDIVSAISTFKRENVTPEKFAQVVQDEVTWFETEKSSMKKTELLKWESSLGKHQELVPIYTLYQKELTKRARYDFDDMLLSTYKALQENPLLLSSLQEQFQYILVDEYQDTNGVQNAIVDLIASFWGENANLFVVGDPNQTIFRFQGAILANTLGFLDRYPNAAIITLDTGYRSNQDVYSASHTLISPILESLIDHPLTKSLTLPLTASHTRGAIEIHTVATDTEELLYLVQEIRKLIENGISPSEVAVLFKRNLEGEQLAELFSRAAIPFHTERESDVLADPILSQFFTLLRLLSALKTTTEHRLLFDSLGFSWVSPSQVQGKISPLLLLQLTRSYSTQKTVGTPFEFLTQEKAGLNKLTNLKRITTDEVQTLHQISNVLADWVSQEQKLTFPEFIQLLAHESGFLSFVETNPKHTGTLQNFIILIREIGKLARGNHAYRLSDFLLYLNTMAEQKLTLSGNHEDSQESVTLATVHKAKGREWQHVFLPFFREGYWGKARGKSGIPLPEGLVAHSQIGDSDHDERRLLFVALTRAKETLHISFALTSQEGDRVSDNLPSPFMSELAALSSPTLATVDPILKNLFVTPIEQKLYDDETRAWLTSVVSSLPLSASSLNAYLEDPKLFFERYVLKLPEATQPHLAFGTAVHAALEFYFRQYQTSDHTHPSIEAVLPVFEHVLRSQVLTENDLASRLDQGTSVLHAYLEEQKNTFPQILALEESFGWKRGKVYLGDVELTGKIDRIDLIDTETKRLRVIDYKTGKPKTMGDIEGTTKAVGLSDREMKLPENIRGRLKRQLLFYKLLLRLDPLYKNFSVDEGIFQFVEPQKGAFTSRSVVLTDQDVEDLQTLIQKVATEIRTLTFLELL